MSKAQGRAAETCRSPIALIQTINFTQRLERLKNRRTDGVERSLSGQVIASAARELETIEGPSVSHRR